LAQPKQAVAGIQRSGPGNENSSLTADTQSFPNAFGKGRWGTGVKHVRKHENRFVFAR